VTTKTFLLLLLIPALGWAATPVVETYQWANNSGATGRALDVTKPTGTADGDLVVLLVACDPTNPGTSTHWVTPSGFSVAGSYGDNISDIETAVFYKVASSEGASYRCSTSWTSNVYMIAYALRISGVHASPFFGATSGNGSNGSYWIAGQLDITVDSTIAFAFAASDGSDTYPADAAYNGWSHYDDQRSPNSSSASGLCAAIGYLNAYAAQTTPVDSILYNASDGSAGFVFSIRGTIAAAATRSQVMHTTVRE